MNLDLVCCDFAKRAKRDPNSKLVLSGTVSEYEKLKSPLKKPEHKTCHFVFYNSKRSFLPTALQNKVVSHVSINVHYIHL